LSDDWQVASWTNQPSNSWPAPCLLHHCSIK
jgi:hypothetical protein